MNYPIWDVPASGLVIAVVAIVHVFVSHFAVGGGLFLVVTERRARRDGDVAMLGFLERLTRFFVLLTLVFGAVTGVGIWFTIGLVSPQATSSLINTFVWGWAIEWTFFVTEITAAMVYYYGWRRLSPGAHMAVGWIYFAAAWLSLVVINGILTYMLTSGSWPETRGFWDGFFNPTYWPGVFVRTFAAAGLAGLYALHRATGLEPDLKARVARYAGFGWILPMGVAVPLGLAWYLWAAAGAGIPVAAILGLEGLTLLDTGHPIAQGALLAMVAASLLVIVGAWLVATLRARSYGQLEAALLMLCGFVALGGGEWVREDLRKPYVIDRFMFVNGVRLPAPAAAPKPPPGSVHAEGDPFAIDALNANGVLQTSPWVALPAAYQPGASQFEALDAATRARVLAQAGAQVFHLECSACHTLDGHLGITRLVRGQSLAAIEKVLDGLARPADGTSWSDPPAQLETWLQRRMPPFVGTEEEEHALAIYLARLGGDAEAGLEMAAQLSGEQVFADQCALCHGPDGWPITELLAGRDAQALYADIGRLEELNEEMPPFEGSDEQRRALSEYLAGLAPAPGAEVNP